MLTCGHDCISSATQREGYSDMCRYNSNTAHQHEVDDMLDAMEETLYQHGVDAVFAGHVHAYESSYPVFRSASLLPTLATRCLIS